MTYWIL